MKKLLAICLVLLLFTASASADWGEGLSPAKPYPSSAEADLTTSIGHMLFSPNARISAAGVKMLFVFLPIDNVITASGELIYSSKDQGEEGHVLFDDAESVYIRPLTEGERESLMWGGGTCVEITLPVSLRLNASYSVEMTRNCIVNGETMIGNDLVGPNQKIKWDFDITSEYGVSEVEYFRVDENGEEVGGIVMPQPGDQVRFNLELGGDAVAAALYVYDNGVEDNNGVDFEFNYFEESCQVTGEVTMEHPAWGVIFLDAEGNDIDFVAF